MTTEEPGGGQPDPARMNRWPTGSSCACCSAPSCASLREAAGVTPDRAGYEIRASRSKISRMETGRVGFKARDVEDLLTFYGVTDEQARSRLLDLAGQSKRLDWWTSYSDVLPGWFENYLGLESVCSTIRTFELQFVHGLFQTEDYARAVTRLGLEAASPAEIERRVGLRVKRQDLLTRANPPQDLVGHGRGGAAPAGRRRGGDARAARATSSRRPSRRR